MRRYKHGSGDCQVCDRKIAATKRGRCWRHGYNRSGRKPCRGSGLPLLGWSRRSRWDRWRLL